MNGIQGYYKHIAIKHLLNLYLRSVPFDLCTFRDTLWKLEKNEVQLDFHIIYKYILSCPLLSATP